MTILLINYNICILIKCNYSEGNTIQYRRLFRINVGIQFRNHNHFETPVKNILEFFVVNQLIFKVSNVIIESSFIFILIKLYRLCIDNKFVPIIYFQLSKLTLHRMYRILSCSV